LRSHATHAIAQLLRANAAFDPGDIPQAIGTSEGLVPRSARWVMVVAK
jgi:hypothetical protein